MEHLLYSLDLSPSDFHLFGPLKKHLGQKRFPDDAVVENAVQNGLNIKSQMFLQGKIFFKLVPRWDKCINLLSKTTIKE